MVKNKKKNPGGASKTKKPPGFFLFWGHALGEKKFGKGEPSKKTKKSGGGFFFETNNLSKGGLTIAGFSFSGNHPGKLSGGGGLTCLEKAFGLLRGLLLSII